MSMDVPFSVVGTWEVSRKIAPDYGFPSDVLCAGDQMLYFDECQDEWEIIPPLLAKNESDYWFYRPIGRKYWFPIYLQACERSSELCFLTTNANDSTGLFRASVSGNVLEALDSEGRKCPMFRTLNIYKGDIVNQIVVEPHYGKNQELPEKILFIPAEMKANGDVELPHRVGGITCAEN